MKRLLSPRWPASICGIALLTFACHAATSLTHLRCEYADNPLGIDTTQPRLSWNMESNLRGQRQTACQVLVATTEKDLDKPDLWDSGRLDSDQSIQVVYAGKPLASRQRAYWKVKVWDKDGKALTSDVAWWEMGLLAADDRQGEWIGYTTNAAAGTGPFDNARWIWFPEGNPATSAPKGERFFRKTIDLSPDATITRATLNLTVDDQFTLYVNGEEVGKSSGKTDAWKAFKTFDLKQRLHPGKNLIAVKAFNDASAAGLIARLDVECSGCPALQVVSDKSWTSANTAADGWTTPGFAADWKPAKEIAKLGEGPWKNTLGGTQPLGQVPHLRKTLSLAKSVKQARLYASALGVYEFYINGKRVGHDVFNPSWTDYNKRVQYHTFDVTGLLKKGDNAVGMILGDGWYAGYVGLGGPHRYGPLALAWAQLEVVDDSGARHVLATDGSWKASLGPLLQSDMLMGETYDARRELPGWATAAYDDSSWKPVLAQKPAVNLVAAVDGPVHRMIELKARAITEPKPDHFIFDIGQNMVGWARLRVKGEAGQTIRLRFAEMLNPDGTVYLTNLRGAKATDYYTCKGGGTETYEPRFTFHGFRYVEVTGLKKKPELDAIQGIVIHSDTPPAGRFECSSPVVNQLQSNIVWGQRGNFLAVPTDCPQRDERLGWMGDAQIFIRTASYNMDVSRFFTKWCQDVEDAQRPDGAFTDVSPFVCCGSGVAAWGDAGVICPWTVYRVYGDTRILERHYAAGQRWIDYLVAHSKDLLRPAQGYGDWLSIKAETPKDVLATAYFALSTRIVADMARTLGKTDDAAKYDKLFADVKAAFNRAYVSDDARIKGDTQTCYVLALAFDLLPQEKRAAATKHLTDDIAAKGDHLSTGFVGVGHLTPTLTRFGSLDVAYKLLNQDTFPGWLYSVKNGATTIWERWDGWTAEKGFQNPGMNSFNHYSLGSVGEWLYGTVAGIDLDPGTPAYKHSVIHPQPGGGITWARADFASIHGRIATDWKLDQGAFRLKVIIPANTTATVIVPATSAESVREGRKPAATAEGVKLVKAGNGVATFEVGSGTYEFTSTSIGTSTGTGNGTGR